MSTTRKSLLPKILWPLGLAVAFYAGTHFGNREAEPAGPDASPSPKSPRGPVSLLSSATNSSAKDPSASGSATEGGKERKTDVSRLIAEARAQLGAGTGMIYHSAVTAKAMAPLTQLSESEIREALTEIADTSVTPQQKTLFYTVLLGRLAETDGAGAMAFVEENPVGQERGYAGSITGSILSAWAQQEPEAAWTWFLENREPGESGAKAGYANVTALFSAFAASNVGSAFSRLEQLSESERNQAVSGIARGGAWEPHLRDQILAQAESLPDTTRSTLYRTIGYQWSQSDPEGAIEWMETLTPEDRRPLLQQAGSVLMASNPQRGAEFMLEGASEKTLPYTYSRIVSQWATRDPNAAGEWLNQQPQGPQLDQARSSFARSVAWKDPYSAMEWAKTVENEAQKTQAVRQVYSQWKRKDQTAADAALDSSGLSSDAITGVRENASRQTSTVKFQSGGGFGGAIQIYP